jgi:hypothetical protein
LDNLRVYEELKSISASQEHLDAYWDIIHTDYESVWITEEHHILPRAIWPQYASLSEHKWNKKALPKHKHIEAHWHLANATMNRSMVTAYILMHGRNMGFSFSVEDSFKYSTLRSVHVDFLKERVTGEGNPMFGKYAELNPFFGKHHSPETITKILNTKNVTPKTINNISDDYISLRRSYSVRQAHSWKTDDDIIIETKNRSDSQLGREWYSDGIDIRRFREHEVPEGFYKSGMGLSDDDRIARNTKIGMAHKGQIKPWVSENINKNPEKIKKTSDKHRGMKRSLAAIENIRQSLRKYNWHTPHGVFDSELEFHRITGISTGSLRKRCINPDDIVTMRKTCKMVDIPIKEDRYAMVGKTWRELGWFTTPAIQNTKS